MPRFWTRVLHPFRHNNKKRDSIIRQQHLLENDTSNSKKTATTTPLFSYSLSSCLTESKIYGDDLVRMDILEHALEDNIETFFCTWNEELERIYEKCRCALDSLTSTIQELSHEICNITSPLQNPNQQSLCNVRQFISDYLKEWQIQHRRNDNSIDSMRKSSSLFDTYFESLQYKCLATKDPGLSHCIQQIYQWEHDFFLFKHYFESQMTILWNTLFDQGTIQRLLQTRWDRRYSQCMSIAQAVEDKMETLLEQSTPSKEDFSCAICLSVFSEPVTIASCLHTFCRPCIQRLYCTCTLSSCSSPCHKASRRQRPEQYYFFSNNNTVTTTFFSLLKGKRTQLQQQKQLFPRRRGYLPQKRHSSILYCKKKQKLLSCQCYRNELETLPFLPTKYHTCPLCRSPFTLKDCTINAALDNFISLYFPYEEKVDDDHCNRAANNMTTTTTPSTPTRRKVGSVVNSGSNEQQYHKRRSVIYNAIHQPFLWISSSSSLRRQQQQQEQMTTMGGSTNLLSSSSHQSDNSTIINEPPLPPPPPPHTRYQQQTATTTATTQPELSEEYGYNDIVNRDLHNLARRTWWF